MTPRPNATTDTASERDVASEAAHWLGLLIEAGTDRTEDRLACEMRVDVRTVRRWRSGQLTPSPTSVAHMATLWLARLAAPGAARYVWGTTAVELEAIGRSLVTVARDPDDIAGRELRRVACLSHRHEGIAAPRRRGGQS